MTLQPPNLMTHQTFHMSIRLRHRHTEERTLILHRQHPRLPRPPLNNPRIHHQKIQGLKLNATDEVKHPPSAIIKLRSL
ncbi:hypothetical protein B005_2605 [Nocardiopsis alba ATCC BAA-2165]|uniref:Uncharacterized protein n=1 Tax=Nocardiopsis alba (strain ATCC BAA-2165 / BE74) TaxID=1205910 RepID=J7L9R8_NOCAA|nr:hypothetical protein B005_2605 [Nocardiopsis alba ATCC BAA-2165]